MKLEDKKKAAKALQELFEALDTDPRFDTTVEIYWDAIKRDMVDEGIIDDDLVPIA